MCRPYFFSNLLWHIWFMCFASRILNGKYIQNFGYVGCYKYVGNMDQYAPFYDNTSEVNTPMTLHGCIQRCRKSSSEQIYAGLMRGSECHCGKEYNQTFAEDRDKCGMTCQDEKECGGQNYMTIWNTDYDVKPLFIVPGNKSDFLQEWNRNIHGEFGNLFNFDVMRSQAIDWWDEKKDLHTPEYVSLMLFNVDGQLLWSVDFFTNDTDSSEVEEWMTVKRILPNSYYTDTMKNNTRISFDHIEGNIKMMNMDNDKVWFAHGALNNPTARVTVFSPDKKAYPEKYIDEKCLKCTSNCNGGEMIFNISQNCDCKDKESGVCRRYSIKKKSGKKFSLCLKDNPNQGEGVNCYLIQDESGNSKICKKLTEGEKVGQSCKNKTLVTEGPNYGFTRIVKSEVERCRSEITFSGPNYICGMGFPGCTGGFSFEVEYSQSLFKKKIEVTDDCKVQKRPCIKFNRLKMNCENQTEYEIYTIAEKSLMMADRLAVVGFYHREEPKVSKWEFLNNFTLAEIKNIMKPVLQRAKSEAKIPVGNLSSSLRKKGSASDFRTSSTGIGILGGSLLGVMFLVIFVSDIVTLKIHLRAMFRNVYHFVRKVTGNLAED